MAYVLCLKEMHVISTTGRSLMLENKLAPQYVPDEVVPELLKVGCVQCDAEGNVLVNGQPIAVRRLQTEVIDPAPKLIPTVEREPPTVSEEMKIDAAVVALLDAGDPSTLDRVHGYPKVSHVSERCGFRVTRLQIQASCQRTGRF